MMEHLCTITPPDIVASILSGPDYFTCDRLRCRMPISVCIERQTRGVRDWMAAERYVPPSCYQCDQGERIAGRKLHHHEPPHLHKQFPRLPCANCARVRAVRRSDGLCGYCYNAQLGTEAGSEERTAALAAARAKIKAGGVTRRTRLDHLPADSAASVGPMRTGPRDRFGYCRNCSRFISITSKGLCAFCHKRQAGAGDEEDARIAALAQAKTDALKIPPRTEGGRKSRRGHCDNCERDNVHLTTPGLCAACYTAARKLSGEARAEALARSRERLRAKCADA